MGECEHGFAPVPQIRGLVGGGVDVGIAQPDQEGGWEGIGQALAQHVGLLPPAGGVFRSACR